MLSKEENESLTRVGRGTPAGELLRRYWQPVATATELSDANPIKRVRILGEDLVLFQLRKKSPGDAARYGLVDEPCSHRLASLANGRVDTEGIRCPYHGWKFAPSGACVEQPAEPPDSKFKERIAHTAYPVQKLGGLLFAYLGPLPAPQLPRWDVLAREDGRRWGFIESVIECNWLQPMENSVDPSHVFWLHGSGGGKNADAPEEQFLALGLQAQYGETNDYVPFEFGIQKVRVVKGKKPGDPPLSEQHPLVFPTALRLVIAHELIYMQELSAAKTFTESEKELGYLHNMQFRMPIDDTHTRVFHVNFMPSRDTVMRADADVPFEDIPLRLDSGEYNVKIVTAQDAMAWETQGALTDRSREHLGVADRGIALLRRVLKEQIQLVREGKDPMGVIRDPVKGSGIIDLDVYHEPFGLRRGEKDATVQTADA